MYVYDIVNRQGVQLARVFPSQGRWQTRANGAGSGSHSFVVADPSHDLSPEDWREFTSTGGDRVLVVSRMKDGIDAPLAVYAGIIDDTDWDDPTGVLTVSHRELRSVLEDRKGAQIPTYTASSTLTVSGKSLRGIARALISRGLISTMGDNWHWPVVLPADEAGSQSRSWEMYKLESIESMLAEVQAADGGPDVAFDPIWSSGMRLEWWARIGTPRIAGSTFEWSASASESPVLSLRERTNSSQQRSGVFAVGAGSGAAMLVGRAGSLAGTPMMDRDADVSYKSVDSQAELDSLALAELKRNREPRRLTSFALHGPDTDLGDTFRIGSRTRIWVEGNAYMSDGWRAGYVTALSGDMSDRIGVEAQP